MDDLDDRSSELTLPLHTTKKSETMEKISLTMFSLTFVRDPLAGGVLPRACAHKFEGDSGPQDVRIHSDQASMDSKTCHS